MIIADQISETSTYLYDVLQQIIEKRDMRYNAIRSEQSVDLEHIILLTKVILKQYDECCSSIERLCRFHVLQTGREYERWYASREILSKIVSDENLFCHMVEEIRKKYGDIVSPGKNEAENPNEIVQAFSQIRTVCGEDYERYQDYLREMMENAKEICLCSMEFVYAPPTPPGVTDILPSDLIE